MSSCQGGQCDHGAQCAESTESDRRFEEQLGKIKRKILVMSGKGGVGKSSVASYVAIGLSDLGFRVGLLDVDFHGPSIPRMLGVSGMLRVNEEEKCMVPHQFSDKLQVASIECFLEDRDTAVVWRGPVKHNVIKQFMTDIKWGDLDYLVIDCPPGTGDEPLSVAQTIPGTHALIVTTPQEIALADVRKSINFCKMVHMPILGLVENMSGYICPHCNQEVPLFGKDGGVRTARKMGVEWLGSLPFDPRVVESADVGVSLLGRQDGGPFVRELGQLVANITRKMDQKGGIAAPLKEARTVVADTKTFRVAIPLADGRLTNHFGHCEQFAIVQVEDGQIQGKELVTPPPHEPGLLPRWLGEKDVHIIIAGGMGQRAIQLFTERSIRVITGAPNLTPEELVGKYLDGTLTTGANVCDH